eukprot:CAMPEP_0197594526 /NCGR_PEP_ID=MMETSP1326-20131121/20747_1 /TAXON_ID=1155430 /ORGANISM="Genus nov. species nov., Strain RCC2288" /LENGTH=52 /DNA_ID=CAMNT_0043160723 /DNA_START=137 /DNA_END=291 /DNA_ORIENTATION=+
MKYPPFAASAQILSVHGQPFSWAQSNRSTDPTKSWTLSGASFQLGTSARHAR